MMHGRHHGDALRGDAQGHLGFRLDFAAALQFQHAEHDLKVVLDPVMGLAEGALHAGQGLAQVGFVNRDALGQIVKGAGELLKLRRGPREIVCQRRIFSRAAQVRNAQPQTLEPAQHQRVHDPCRRQQGGEERENGDRQCNDGLDP